MFKNAKTFNFMQETKKFILKQFRQPKSYQQQKCPKWPFLPTTYPQNCGNVDNLPILSPICPIF